jgi:hypothetical protein
MNMRIALLPVLLFAALASACGNGDDPAPSPTNSSPADLSPRVGGLEAMREHLSSEGLDGNTGQVTDPADCKELPQGGADEEFCIIDDASNYGPGVVILYVARVDSRDDNRPDLFNDVWEVHLEPGENAWQVTDVEEVQPP